jgi:hypothetical protein
VKRNQTIASKTENQYMQDNKEKCTRLMRHCILLKKNNQVESDNRLIPEILMLTGHWN